VGRVFYNMNGGIPVKVCYSTTLDGEMHTDRDLDQTMEHH